MRFLLPGVLLGTLLVTSGLSQTAPVAPASASSLDVISTDLKALLANGPRVAGSESIEKARGYLEAQFKALGYETRRDEFTYGRFDDLGSDVRVGSRTIAGNALQGSKGAEVTALLALVSGVGTPSDVAAANVRGKIAVISRGQNVPFAQKARNALDAGAVGVIIVNNTMGELRGTLGGTLDLPVLGVSQADGALLRSGDSVTLRVRTVDRTVRGANVVAYKKGVTAPEILFGGHMDSVVRAPGANDNASGTAAVLDVARRVANTPLSARAYFVLFDGEEDGLRGSRAFVANNSAATRGLRAMFNFDMVGVDVTPLAVGGTDSLSQAAQRVIPSLQVFRDSGGSDHGPFIDAGVPSLFFHRGIDVNYHQPGDVTADPTLIRDATDTALKLLDTALPSAR
ncbi:M28 family peptidase [Deinococcus yavapaiensis]|nr:M28 family peptidase [Deinococcus yavapaiensis]